jgi:hypothetical protein
MFPSSAVKVPTKMSSSESKPSFGVQIRVPDNFRLLDLLGVDPVYEALGLETP